MEDKEVKDLILRAKDGSKDAKSFLIDSSMKYIKKIANGFCLNNKSLSLEDLMQEGIIAVIKAINSYDLDKNVKFSTYVYSMINFTLISEIKKKYSYFKIPEHQVSKIVKFKRRASELKVEDTCYKYGCERIGLSYEQYADMMHLSKLNNVAYLDEKKYFDGKVSEEDKFAYEDVNYKRVEEKIDLNVILKENADKLSQLEKYIIREILIKDQKVKNISKITKMSTKKISNIKYSALKKIQNSLKNS
ncbi:RNA polymerase sporulation-specific sigma factor [Clostridium acetobutylicum]|uniref:sigma-70 family RNA polymerase sigma factor n=1 Tax=Clostridium acetobutylicum TaxID=1488 RepID=UPI000200A6AA|nr:RNA polymerase sigma factor RpoD/SigA [Clostridium acetobutylicum]ADZ21103.1 DNA-dependent RNA polymerase sigma subunit [Clostridium acetobutylicum EA 2018]AEI32158.1 DNA-dependent RNA polymerase sigma subunit [Clostridium acetobutylicum DSM 1731]MBC2394466.1 RNA polymerase sigma factor RpoD/SigA [Clostridium acetobutylicum]MBC2583428.1 RNA polymerase sigma factor RpoD/SigA [Clostridium acetobutylicum]NOV88863.1 RNA polymerase sporulation-specific sigma factor [Clostridium acetobutylicum]